VLEPLSDQVSEKGSKWPIAAVQICHAQNWRFTGGEFIVAACRPVAYGLQRGEHREHSVIDRLVVVMSVL
jgi:hypothetical protein